MLRIVPTSWDGSKVRRFLHWPYKASASMPNFCGLWYSYYSWMRRLIPPGRRLSTRPGPGMPTKSSCSVPKSRALLRCVYGISLRSRSKHSPPAPQQTTEQAPVTLDASYASQLLQAWAPKIGITWPSALRTCRGQRQLGVEPRDFVPAQECASSWL